MSLADKIFTCFKGAERFTLKEAYEKYSDKPAETIRARIYDNLGVKFKRIAKGIYCTVESENEKCIVLEGDGRDLSIIEDNSIDCIFTDHPWLDIKSNKGGTRAFAVYDCFKYTLDDFKEKARVLKDGCFLVEVLPAENENNYEYLYQIKQYAKEAGFIYYSKVAWKKGTFVSNTGRKAKNTQDIMIFSKGKARNMRIDTKRTEQTGKLTYMSGCKGMLPTKVNDGAYDTMIKRIESINNPNFFFMNYNKQDLHVKDFLMVPKYFFSPEIIEKRKPLSDTARRAGWVGCNIVLKQIPEEGRIFIVKNEIEIPQKEIISKVKRTDFIKQYKLDARGWVLDVLNCVNQIEGRDFTLEQMYKFEDVLSKKHPDNNHIKDKIRQQLQILRDKGILEFRGRGHYRKSYF